MAGTRRVESYLERLYWAVKAEDPNGLVTYVNYPTTEYLHLPFLDLVTFNVYLESQDQFDAYLARLHNIAGDRPLLMSEIGLDSFETERQLRRKRSSGNSGAPSHPVVQGPLYFRGLMSGTGPVPKSKIGHLASPPRSSSQTCSRNCSGGVHQVPCKGTPVGRRFLSSSVPLMAAALFLNAWRVCLDLSILITKSSW